MTSPFVFSSAPPDTRAPSAITLLHSPSKSPKKADPASPKKESKKKASSAKKVKAPAAKVLLSRKKATKPIRKVALPTTLPAKEEVSKRKAIPSSNKTSRRNKSVATGQLVASRKRKVESPPTISGANRENVAIAAVKKPRAAVASKRAVSKKVSTKETVPVAKKMKTAGELVKTSPSVKKKTASLKSKNAAPPKLKKAASPKISTVKSSKVISAPKRNRSKSVAV